MNSAHAREVIDSMANVNPLLISMLSVAIFACGPSYKPESSESSGQAPGMQQPHSPAPATPAPSNVGMLRTPVPPDYVATHSQGPRPISPAPIPVGPQPQPPVVQPVPVAPRPVPVAPPQPQPPVVQPVPVAPVPVPRPPVTPTQPSLQPRFQAILTRHNQHRANHCAAPLRWSAKLAAKAQRWADQLKNAGCAFEHSQNSPYGENLFAFSPAGNMSPEQVATGWYDEVKLYNFAQGGFSMSTGHFTQLIWRNTTSLGCGVSMCNGGEIWVCNYDPPGNVRGFYDRQVLPTSCQ